MNPDDLPVFTVDAAMAPHLIAEHTGLTGAQAAAALDLLTVATISSAVQQWAIEDVAALDTDQVTLADLLEQYTQHAQRADRTDDDGESLLDLWRELPPGGRVGVMLAAAWAAREAELPQVEGYDLPYDAAAALHTYAQDWTGTAEEFVPQEPGALPRHPGALFISGYLHDSEEPEMDQLTAYLLLVWAARRAHDPRRTGSAS